jgi:hypothetical protein
MRDHASIITNTNGLPIAKRILYVYGYVRYYDLFKVMRRTGFMFEYIATEMRQKKAYL